MSRKPAPPQRKVTETDREIARQGRLVALVIAGAGALWVIAQMLIPQLGIPLRYAVLIDLFALAAFVWAMIVIYRMWRKRRTS